jgi:hypothetical protein
MDFHLILVGFSLDSFGFSLDFRFSSDFHWISVGCPLEFRWISSFRWIRWIFVCCSLNARWVSNLCSISVSFSLDAHLIFVGLQMFNGFRLDFLCIPVRFSCDVRRIFLGFRWFFVGFQIFIGLSLDSRWTLV